MQPCWWSPPTPQPASPLFSPPPLPYLAALPAGSAPFSRCIGHRRCPSPVRVFTPGTTPSPRQRCNPTCRWSTSAEASPFPPARAFPKRGGNRRAFGSEGIFSLSLFPLPPWGCEGKRRSGSWFEPRQRCGCGGKLPLYYLFLVRLPWIKTKQKLLVEQQPLFFVRRSANTRLENACTAAANELSIFLLPVVFALFLNHGETFKCDTTALIHRLIFAFNVTRGPAGSVSFARPLILFAFKLFFSNIYTIRNRKIELR